MKHPFYRCAAAAFVATALFAGPAAAEEDHIAPIKELAATKVAVWTASPILVDAVNAQNAANAAITQGDIDKMDKTWRAEIKSGGGPMSQKILANALSAYLKKVKSESAGLYSEIFVMDNKGLNVGQSDPTSDFWQGDEAKWQKTYSAGPKAVHIGKVKTDESSQTLQSQLSMSIVDPANGKVIGSVTIGVNVEQLVE